jgi:hypothetical protein
MPRVTLFFVRPQRKNKEISFVITQEAFKKEKPYSIFSQEKDDQAFSFDSFSFFDAYLCAGY